jgi:hypothetical protein
MTNTKHGPGSRLRRFAERTLEPETLERVVLPALADLQHECREDARGSRLVRLRAYWALWKTLALCLLIESGTYGRPMVGGVMARLTIIFPIVLGIVMVPALNAAFGGPPAPAQLLLASVPQALIAALPIAFFFAVALERHPRSLRRLVPAVFAMALVCTLVMMVVTLSVVPRANDVYARSVAGQLKAAGRPAVVSFGSSEWRFTELVQRTRSETSERDRETARQVLGMRLAQSTWPIMLGFLALGIAGYERVHALFMGVWVLIFYIAALRAAAPSSFQSPSVRGVWLVNAAFVLAGLCLVWLRPNPLSDEPKGYVIS